MSRGWGALAKWASFFDDANASPSSWSPNSTAATGPAGPQGVAGPAGAQGPAGPQGAAGPAGLNWKGAWAAGTAYAINDAVGFGGASYFSLTNANTGNQPDTSPAQWALLASQGATGPQGAQGIQGIQGPTGPQGPAGAGGSLTTQDNTLGADHVIAANVTFATFSDNFAAGTWDIDFTVCCAAQGGLSQVALTIAGGTATVTLKNPVEVDGQTNANFATSIVASFRVVVTVAGTVILNTFASANGATLKATRTAYTALKVA